MNPLINGSMACFNHHTNVDLDSKYIVFDFNGMKGSLLTMSMFVVLDFVWTKSKRTVHSAKPYLLTNAGN